MSSPVLTMTWVDTRLGMLVLLSEDCSHDRETRLSPVSGDILSIQGVSRVELALPCDAIISI